MTTVPRRNHRWDNDRCLRCGCRRSYVKRASVGPRRKKAISVVVYAGKGAGKWGPGLPRCTTTRVVEGSVAR